MRTLLPNGKEEANINPFTFVPKRVYFEPRALEYPLGQELHEYFTRQKIPILRTTSHNRVTGIPGSTPAEGYREAKNTLVVGVRKSKDFQTCKPSAHYQLPLATSCPGKCEYCYLQTTLGKKPYLRVYVNVEEILDKAKEYIVERAPEITFFEGSATSDPIPVEPYTHSMKKAIEFFGKQEHARISFVTKFTNIEGLLNLDHRQHTFFRFSINLDKHIKKFEHSTPGLEERLKAASKIIQAGYPTGLMIAPIFLEKGWREDYSDLLQLIKKTLPDSKDLTFELISHRFTARAKKNILDIYPDTELPMTEDTRTFKFGQFGYGKYLYPKELMNEAKTFFEDSISELFPEGKIKYFV